MPRRTEGTSGAEAQVRRFALILLAAGMTAADAADSVPAPDQAARVAATWASHLLCSTTFVAGLDPEQIYAENVKPVPAMSGPDGTLDYEIDRIRREVRTRIAGGVGSRAIYRPGLGCLVVQNDAPDAVDPDAVVQNPAAAPPVPDVAGPAVVQPGNDGLRLALDRAFAEADRPPYRRTKAVVVVHEGRVVAERYAPGYGIDTPLIGWSVTKSVTSALVGILVRQGRLVPEQPAPIPAWQAPDDPRRAITIDALLRMTSSLALEETLTGSDAASRMLFLERDPAGFAGTAALRAAPGRIWSYSSGNYELLSRIVRDAVGGHASDVLDFAHRELFDPLGMRHVTLEFDATGTPMGAIFMLAPARDWARFGLLYLNDGMLNGRRILPPGWVRYSASSTLNSGYGAGFWTSLDTSAFAQSLERAGLPRGSFLAIGLFGQYVIVVPSERLVIARFGVSQRPPEIENGAAARLAADVISALH
jgi:CubicO group peptidase (beta-lactamase class C family)